MNLTIRCLSVLGWPFEILPMQHMQEAWTVLSYWQQQHQEASAAPASTATAADQTSVVAALSFWDYSLLYDGTAGEAYKATGRCFSVAAGRISYVYGLRGKRSADI